MKKSNIEYTLRRKKIKRINLRVKGDGTVHVSAPIRTPQAVIDDFVDSCEDMILKAQMRLNKIIEERKNLYPGLQFVEGEQVFMLGQFFPLHVVEVQCKKQERAWFNGRDITIYVLPEHTFEVRKQLFQRMWRLYCNKVFSDILTKVQQEFLSSIYSQNNPSQVTMKEFRVREMKSRWGSCMPQRKIITLNSRLLSFDPSYIEYVAIHEFAHFVEPNHSARFHAVVTHFMPNWQEYKQGLNQQGSLVYG